MKKPKVVLIDFGAMYGGGQVYLLRLTQLLAEHADFRVLCSNDQLKAALREAGIPVIGFKPVRGIYKLTQMILGALSLLRLRLSGHADVVWLNGIPEIIYSPIARLLGCTVIVTRHLSMNEQALALHRQSNRAFSERLFARLAPTVNRLICVSEAVASDLLRVLPVKLVSSIPNWVPRIPKETDHDPRIGAPIRLLFVGRLQRYKGAQLILEALKTLQASRPEHMFRLTIVGDGEFRHELQALARGLDVEFAGFQANTDAYYSNADLFINPTEGPEGLPLVSLEAMACGLPCILSDLPVHKEISKNAEAAVLFRVGDSSDLASRLAELADLSGAEWKRVGSMARATVLERYSPDVAKRSYVEVLRWAWEKAS